MEQVARQSHLVCSVQRAGRLAAAGAPIAGVRPGHRAVQHGPRVWPAGCLRRSRHGTREQLAPAQYGSIGPMRGEPSRRTVAGNATCTALIRPMPNRAISGAPSSGSCRLAGTPAKLAAC